MVNTIHCIEFNEQDPCESGSKLVTFTNKIGNNAHYVSNHYYFVVDSNNRIIQYFDNILSEELVEALEGNGYSYELIKP